MESTYLDGQVLHIRAHVGRRQRFLQWQDILHGPYRLLHHERRLGPQRNLLGTLHLLLSQHLQDRRPLHATAVTVLSVAVAVLVGRLVPGVVSLAEVGHGTKWWDSAVLLLLLLFRYRPRAVG